MKEAISVIVFLLGLLLITIGIAFYLTEGSLATAKLAVASGVWLKLYWVSTLQENPLGKI